MNDIDIVATILLVTALLCLAPTFWVSPLFILLVGALVAVALVLALTSGSMCQPKDEYPSHTHEKVRDLSSHQAQAQAQSHVPTLNVVA